MTQAQHSSERAQLSDKTIIIEAEHWLNADACGWSNLVNFARAVIAADRATATVSAAEPVAWEWCDTIHSDHCHTSDEEAIAEGWMPLVYGNTHPIAAQPAADNAPSAHATNKEKS